MIEMVQASLRIWISLQPEWEVAVMDRLADLLPSALAPIQFVPPEIHVMPPFG
jgi:hypothetical protein